MAILTCLLKDGTESDSVSGSTRFSAAEAEISHQAGYAFYASKPKGLQNNLRNSFRVVSLPLGIIVRKIVGHILNCQLE
jgi:hypothetical protein